MLFNILLSRVKAKFITVDTENRLNTPMSCPEYMKINTKMIPQETIYEYSILLEMWLRFAQTKEKYNTTWR